MPTGGVNSPLLSKLSCSALPRADETLTYYSVVSCRSHAQEMARRLTEDAINQELMRLGLHKIAMIKAPSVVASGGGSSSDKDLVALVAGICAAAVALLLFVCVCCYCWKKRNDRTDQSQQQVEMQQGAGNVNPPAIIVAAAQTVPAGTGLMLGGGAGVPVGSAVGGPRGHGGVGSAESPGRSLCV